MKTQMILLGLAISPLAVAANELQQPVILSQGGQKVEVSVEKSKVQVKVLKRTKEFPGALGITLLDRDGKPTLLQLKTIDPNQNPLLYSTSLTGGTQSYVGFELRIPFRKGRPMIMKSVGATEFGHR